MTEQEQMESNILAVEAAKTMASNLTKREHFAGLAMQSLLTVYQNEPKIDGEMIAILAVGAADNLLKELERQEEMSISIKNSISKMLKAAKSNKEE